MGISQADIDAVEWYHEFDFGNGLKARAKGPEAEDHRNLWAFLRQELDKIDFRGKTVLDIGCWDGYWSFYAERRGAAHVLATDDISQNWSSGRGIHIARELLGSSIEIDQSLSIYDLGRLQRKFDIVLCLGVYYHLIDPYYGFAQVRHCCGEGSLAVFQGDACLGIRPDTYWWNVTHKDTSCFIPTATGLSEMLRAAYFDVTDQRWMDAPHKPSFRRRVMMLSAAWGDFELDRLSRPTRMGLLLTQCRPMTGENPRHVFRPPFGLEAYDTRFARK